MKSLMILAMCILQSGCAASVKLDDRWISCDALSPVYIEDSSSLTRREMIQLIKNNEIIEKYCP